MTYETKPGPRHTKRGFVNKRLFDRWWSGLACVVGCCCAALLASLVAATPGRADIFATFDGSVLGPSGVFVVNKQRVTAA